MEIKFEFKFDVVPLSKFPPKVFFVSSFLSVDHIAEMVTKEAPVVGSSFPSRLMAKTSSDAVDVFRYIFDDDRQPLSLYERLDSEDDNYSTDGTFGNFWKTFDEDFIEEEQEEDEASLPPTSPFRKKTITVYDRKPQDNST